MTELAIVIGYAVAVFGGSPVVAGLLRRVLADEDRQAISSFQARGLRDGGRIIGWAERALILTFVLLSEFAAIGLVLAAKGLIRYGEIKEAKDQKIAEYVLIGTMFSITWAVLVGVLMIRYVL